jgi:hypothetical protein
MEFAKEYSPVLNTAAIPARRQDWPVCSAHVRAQPQTDTHISHNGISNKDMDMKYT